MGVVVIVEECVRDVGLRWGRIYMYERRAAVLKPEGWNASATRTNIAAWRHSHAPSDPIRKLFKMVFLDHPVMMMSCRFRFINIVKEKWKQWGIHWVQTQPNSIHDAQPIIIYNFLLLVVAAGFFTSGKQIISEGVRVLHSTLGFAAISSSSEKPSLCDMSQHVSPDFTL